MSFYLSHKAADDVKKPDNSQNTTLYKQQGYCSHFLKWLKYACSDGQSVFLVFFQ